MPLGSEQMYRPITWGLASWNGDSTVLARDSEEFQGSYRALRGSWCVWWACTWVGLQGPDNNIDVF